MGRYTRLRRIRKMDPQQDYEEIFALVTRYEFPWDYLQGVSVAFLRDYGVPASPGCWTAPRSSSARGRNASTTRS